eukprot:g5416.t1
MSNVTKDEQEVDSAEFARILTKQAVAHVCVALGFTATTPGALECLTDVVQRYVESMAKRTMENTYRAGRTEPNVPDVLQGFQQLPIPLRWTELRDFAFSEDGFSSSHGASSAAADNSGGGSSSSSSNAAAAGTAVAEAEVEAGADGSKAGGGRGGREMPKRWDQPFHHTVPPFPMPRKRRNPWAEGGEEGAGNGADGAGGQAIRPPHIPAFMPPLPPSSSRAAPGGSGRSLAEIRLERLKRQRQGETALRSLGAPVAAAAGSGITPASAGTAAATGGSSSGGMAKPGGGSSSAKIIIRLPSAGAGAGAMSSAVANGNGAGDVSGGAKPRQQENGGASSSGSTGRATASAASAHSSQRHNGGFRKITPNAAGARARLSSAGGGGGGREDGGDDKAAASGNGVKARVLKGIAGGGRGAFGKSGDSTREDRILEGMPPDGTGDMDTAA